MECVAWANDSCRVAINESLSTDNKKGTYEGPFLVSGSRDKTIKVSWFFDRLNTVVFSWRYCRWKYSSNNRAYWNESGVRTRKIEEA